jgi:hypothetical protein
MGWQLRRAVRSEAGTGSEGEKAGPQPKANRKPPHLRGFSGSRPVSRIFVELVPAGAHGLPEREAMRDELVDFCGFAPPSATWRR